MNCCTAPVLLALTLVLPVLCQTECPHYACGATCADPVNRTSPFCGCDRDCGWYGDCCGNSTLSPPSSCPPPLLNPLQSGVQIECISAYIVEGIPVQDSNEAFLMVTSCPDSWPVDGGSTVAANCASQDLSLPPVTDTMSGLVYRNEYCAICNGATAVQAWQVTIACTPFVYQKLSQQNISAILQEDPDIFTTKCRPCSYQPPPLSSQQPRTCIPAVRSCLSQADLEQVTQTTVSREAYTALVSGCLSGGQSLVESSGTRYHNSECAQCNGVDSSCFTLINLSTLPIDCAPPTFSITISPIPYTITLKGLQGRSVAVQTETETSHIMVECPEGEVPVGLVCRPTQCPESYTETGGRCVSFTPADASSTNCTLQALEEGQFTDLGNDTILFEGVRVMILDRDESGQPLICANASFLDCPTAYVALNDTEFQDVGNGTILHNNETVEVMFYDDLGRPLVCASNGSILLEVNRTITTPISLPPGIAELTYIGCSLSVLGCLVMILTYALFSDQRTLPKSILTNLSLAILITNLFFLVGGPVIQHFPSVDFCIAVAICLHFFFLAQFTWMSLFSFQMAHTFYLARKLVAAAKTKKFELLIYMLIGWCLPLVVTVVTVAVNFSLKGLVLYGVTEDGRVGNCWINHVHSLIGFFVVPLVLCLLINFTLFIIVSIFLCQIAKNKSKLDKSNHTVLIRVWLAFFSITGLTWLFGFLAITRHTSWAWYPFVLFNSTQGFGIFLAFLFTRSTLKLYAELLTHKKKKKPSLRDPPPAIQKTGDMKLIPTSLPDSTKLSVDTNYTLDDTL